MSSHLSLSRKKIYISSFHRINSSPGKIFFIWSSHLSSHHFTESTQVQEKNFHLIISLIISSSHSSFHRINSSLGKNFHLIISIIISSSCHLLISQNQLKSRNKLSSCHPLIISSSHHFTESTQIQEKNFHHIISLVISSSHSPSHHFTESPQVSVSPI